MSYNNIKQIADLMNEDLNTNNGLSDNPLLRLTTMNRPGLGRTKSSTDYYTHNSSDGIDITPSISQPITESNCKFKRGDIISMNGIKYKVLRTPAGSGGRGYIIRDMVTNRKYQVSPGDIMLAQKVGTEKMYCPTSREATSTNDKPLIIEQPKRLLDI